MSEFHTVRWLESVDRSNLTDTQYEILRVIAYGTDRDGRNARFTNKQLAAEVGKVAKTANRTIPVLIDRGLIDRTSVGNSKTNTHSTYDLVRGSDGLSVPSSNRGHEQRTLGNPKQGTSTGDIDQMSPVPTRDMSPVLTSGMSLPYREISLEISSSRELERDTSGVPHEGNISDVPPDASLAVGEGQEQSEPSPWGSVSAIEGSDPQESEPSEDVSSSVGTSSEDVPPQPDILTMSGVSDHQPSTGSEAMNNTDPWANTTVRYDQSDPWAVATPVAPAPKREPETFQMGRGQFIGPETDPLTDGPNWEQGPRQLP